MTRRLWVFGAGLLAGVTMASVACAEPAGLIVRLREAAPAEQRVDVRERTARVLADQRAPLGVGARVSGPWHALQPRQPMSAQALRAWAARLRADPRVAAVVRPQREQPMAVTPSDSLYEQQWWLKSVAGGNTGVAGFAGAWERSTGAPVSGAAPVVAVLDSGVVSHPDLDARVVGGYDFVSDADYANDGNGRDADFSDRGNAVSDAERAAQPDVFGDCPQVPVSTWHGTLIGGQVAAVSNNGAGVAGASWAAGLLAVRVAGKCGADIRDVIDGMRWAAGLAVAGVPRNTAHPARLIVLTYGNADPCNADHSDPEVADAAALYLDAIAEVRQAGALVFVAAGNDNAQVGRPAGCLGAFAVAALNREGYKAKYANFGPQIALSAPGGDTDTGATCDQQLADTGIASTGNPNGQPGYASAAGSSFAAPMAAGAAALMLAVNPDLSVDQIEQGLRRSARPHVQVDLLGDCSLADNRGRCTCTTDTCGAGMLDAVQALAYAEAPDSYVAPTRTAVSLRDERIEACAVLLGKPVTPEEPEEEPPEAPEESGGGGAMQAGWLLALAAAALALRWLRPQPLARSWPRLPCAWGDRS